MLYVATSCESATETVKDPSDSHRADIAQVIAGKTPTKTLGLLLLVICFTAALAPGLRAEVPPLLAKAIQRWNAGRGDMAFTQETKRFQSNGGLKEERVERFDPSLPDSRRWRLIEVNGTPANEDERKKWESRKNAKPRRKVDESPGEYLDLDHAVLVSETPMDARFQVPLLPSAEHLVAVSGIDVVITVDRQTQNVARIGAVLREPIHALMGLAEITDLDVDLQINPAEGGSATSTDEVLPGSTARVKISRLGRPVEYAWSDFKRVTSFAGADVRSR